MARRAPLPLRLAHHWVQQSLGPKVRRAVVSQVPWALATGRAHTLTSLILSTVVLTR